MLILLSRRINILLDRLLIPQTLLLMIRLLLIKLILVRHSLPLIGVFDWNIIISSKIIFFSRNMSILVELVLL